ncbi:hypothetical protein, partial [Pseudomonas aeruginosa]|uniref:hypothetical protein n=1 Tax=Pseudomonas aeruginosa TaxID=287 RepID=UPI001C609B2F
MSLSLDSMLSLRRTFIDHVCCLWQSQALIAHLLLEHRGLELVEPGVDRQRFQRRSRCRNFGARQRYSIQRRVRSSWLRLDDRIQDLESGLMEQSIQVGLLGKLRPGDGRSEQVTLR